MCVCGGGGGGGLVASFALSITGHEQTLLNRVCYFHSLVYSLLLRNPTIQNLLITVELQWLEH